jgi:HAD superfamily hydrolase (TIGR01509 family)
LRSDLAVLFDLDGVIVDSRAQHLGAWHAWAREHAPHAPEGYFERTFGLRNDAIIGGVLGEVGSDEFQRLAAHKEVLFRERARGSLVALPGVRDVLDWLDEQAIPRAIVTSTPRENLDLVLETLGLAGRFGALVAEEDAARGKPDPEGFLVAAERLGVPPARCTVIEDAPAGLEAARAAAMRTIALTTTRPAADLDTADLVVGSLADARVRNFLLK